MRAITITTLFTILRIVVLAQSTATKSNADPKAIAYLEKFRAVYTQAMLQGEPSTIVPYLSEKIRLMPEFQLTLDGKTNASRYYEALTSRFTINDYKRSMVEIIDLGRQVMELGKVSIGMTLKTTGKRYDINGSYINLWEEKSDGDLSLLTETWNYNEYYAEVHDILKFPELAGIHTATLPNVLVKDPISFQLAAFSRLLDVTVTEHDPVIWSQYYADDAILIPNYSPMIQGKKAIDEYIQKHVKELPVFQELDIRTDRIDNLGDYVVEYASHIASWKNGDSSGVGFGKNIKVWRRQGDHSLKIFRSMAMYD